MALDEAMRHRIHGRFEELLGHEEAAALMTTITQADRVDERFDRLETLFADVRAEVGALRTEFNHEIHQLYRWTIGSIFAAISLGAALIRLTG